MEPDDRNLFDALREAGASEQTAYKAMQEVRNVSSQNVITEISAKIEALNTKMDADRAVTEARFAGLDAKMDADRVITEARFAQLDTKIEAQGARLDYLATKDDLQKTKVWWLVAAGTAVLSFLGTLLSNLAR